MFFLARSSEAERKISQVNDSWVAQKALNRSSHRRCSVKKHLCQGHFFNKVVGLRLAQVFSSEFCKISKSTFSPDLQTTASYWIFLGIFMFSLPNLYITSGLTNGWFFTSTFTLINCAWFRWIFTFTLKQLLDFFLNSLYEYAV